MKLFDLHCDTATVIFDKKESLYQNSCHVSLDKAAYLEQYAQVMAIWTKRSLSDSQGYERFLKVVTNLKSELEINKEHVCLVSDSRELKHAIAQGKTPIILAVEDARIIENDLSRLVALHSEGVRVLTLNWSGESCIGGAHDTGIGLSEFGILTVESCFEMGIIPDISHCSFEGAKMTLELAKKHSKPIIASHSDSYSINPHTRNLKDEYFADIIGLNGLVGINLCPDHLVRGENANISHILAHIEHYLSLGGEDVLAMGADLDGTGLPDGFESVSDIYKIANEMQRLNYSNELIEKITYKNALDFFIKNIQE